MKINSFDPLFEYPEYNQTGTSAKANAAAKSVTAPGKKPSQAPSASPTTTGNKISEPEPKEPTIAKASELKKDFEFPDEKGNVLKVISPVGQRTDLPNDMEDVVIAQDAKKNVVVFDKDADIALPQVEVEESKLDDIIDPKKKSFAKKLMRKQNKLKHLIRAAKFDAQDAAGGVLYEINFNNANVIKAALDAPIQCGFEAETVWTEVGGGGTAIDFNYTDWDEIKDAILDQEGRGAVDDIEEAFNSWAAESDQFYDIESDVIAEEVKDREEDEYYINAYADAELFRDDVEDYKEEVMSDLRSRATQGDMFSDNDEEGDPDADEEYAERQDWDYDAWAREFVEEQHMDDLREWLADQIRDNGEHWDQAWDEFYRKYDIDSWVGIEYRGDWLEMLSDHSVYGLAGSDDEYDLDEVATALEDWASNNSYSNDVRPGSYHSGSGTDNKYWRVEEDSSIEGSGAKAEIISPVYQTPREMLSEMNSLFKFMQANNVETNSSTGFHVTMSMGTGEDQSPNQLKLAVLLNDNYLLKQFNRVGNTYATSQLDRVKNQLLRAIDGDDQSLAALEQSLGGALSQDKFNSINFKGIDNELGNQMVEFRIAGGSNYVVKFQDLSKAAIKYAVTLQAAHDPDAFRQDYLKALYKMINQADSGTLKTSRKDGNVNIPDTPGAEGLKNLVNEIPSAQDRLENFERIATMYQDQGSPQTFKYYSNYIIGKVIHSFIAQGREPESLKFSPSLARGLRAALKEFGMTPQSYMDWAMGPSGMTWMADDELRDRWTLAVVRGILAMPNLTPTGYTPPEQKEENMDFDSLSLEEQLQFVSKLDKAKIDEAWSQKYKDSINCSDPKGFSQKAHCAGKKKKKESVEEADQVKAKERKPKIVKPNKGHQSKHPYKGRLVGEGAVPETKISDEFAQLMNKPLLGSDIKSQMYAYQIVPDPAMIKEFRNMIASGGKDVDLRPIFKSFASAKLHPVQKKQVGLAESVLMEKGLSLADMGKRNNFTVFKQKISSSSPFAATDGAEVVIAPTLARKIKTVDDLKQFLQGRQVMLPLKNEPGYVVPLSYLLKTAEFGGTAKKETGVANRGELAEGVLGAATFARIAKRPGKPITYNEVLKVIQSLPKTDTGGSISKNVKTSGVTDKITLTVRLGANTYADLIDTQKLTSDALMNSYIKSTVQFVNDYTRLYANFFEQNGRPDEVEIVSDGVSENTDRKTDVYMIYVDEAGNRQLKHFDISLKAGTVKQFGQVGYGRSSSPIEGRFAKVMELFTQFGIDQNSFTFDPKQFQDDDGITLIKDLYKQAVELINQKLAGSDPANEYQYLDQLAQGVTYFATSNDPTVKLLQLDKGRYYVLDFKKLRPKLDGIDLEAQYAETSSGDPIVRIHDKNNPKNSGRLLQIRTKHDSNGYIRQILEKEPLLKKLISVRHVGDIEK